MLGKVEGRRRRGRQRTRWLDWHPRLSGHKPKQTPGDGEGQGSLVCCSPRGCKESDMTEQVKFYELHHGKEELERTDSE